MPQSKDNPPIGRVRRLGPTESELAERWGVSNRTLQRWRRAGQGPAFLRIGRRVIYPLADVEAFEQAVRAPKGGAR